jgi:hypothetical protein
VLDFALGSAFCSVLSVGKRDAAVAEFEEEFLDHVLKLFDVDEKRPLLFHPKLDFGANLTPDGLLCTYHGACGGDGAVNFVANPRNDVWFAVEGLWGVSSDDFWEAF